MKTNSKIVRLFTFYCVMWKIHQTALNCFFKMELLFLHFSCRILHRNMEFYTKSIFSPHHLLSVCMTCAWDEGTFSDALVFRTAGVEAYFFCKLKIRSFNSCRFLATFSFGNQFERLGMGLSKYGIGF